MAIDISIKKTLGDFNLDVSISSQNDITAILGASGCGKSLTLRCIAGIEKPDEGHIIINDIVYFDSKKGINLSPQKRNVGILFQDYALFPNMTVYNNILTGLERLRERNRKCELVKESIKRFSLEGLENYLPHQLSGGQQQRVALARMLIGNPEVVLLDEPFAALDEYLRDKIMIETKRAVLSIKRDTILVTHSREEAFRFSDKLIIMDDGVVLETGFTKDIFNSPKTKQGELLTGNSNCDRSLL